LRRAATGDERETLDLTVLARSAWDELAPDLVGRDVEFQLQPLPPGRGDPRLIRQVLANLLGNAVKYTRKQEHATIVMGCQVTAASTVYYVRDNGVGFDMRHADEVFKVFRRLHTAADFPGTGIGLASVQRIINRHGGEVWAEGRPTEGATFYFTLTREPVGTERSIPTQRVAVAAGMGAFGAK
jgi:signal transduction histidine kinase